ncbi:Hypothetical predicted protein [Olea europaea subsp. europaea]|uniref:Uncharacterized protein n=1 Tax=Olea europaea subsp. europaea TaxID=158383 RepID=A0A8S0U4D2_OLEEU|nr:Hypothetical predicted protein [Olea europaea subsp. europaea]
MTTTNPQPQFQNTNPTIPKPPTTPTTTNSKHESKTTNSVPHRHHANTASQLSTARHCNSAHRSKTINLATPAPPHNHQQHLVATARTVIVYSSASAHNCHGLRLAIVCSSAAAILLGHAQRSRASSKRGVVPIS